jgi:hypothetical protein
MNLAINVALMIIAGFLSFSCNRKENIVIRIIYFIIAIIFAPFYLIYYVFFHYIFREPCFKSYIKAGVPTRLL